MADRHDTNQSVQSRPRVRTASAQCQDVDRNVRNLDLENPQTATQSAVDSKLECFNALAMRAHRACFPKRLAFLGGEDAVNPGYTIRELCSLPVPGVHETPRDPCRFGWKQVMALCVYERNIAPLRRGLTEFIRQTSRKQEWPKLRTLDRAARDLRFCRPRTCSVTARMQRHGPLANFGEMASVTCAAMPTGSCTTRIRLQKAGCRVAFGHEVSVIFCRHRRVRISGLRERVMK